ncbi:MAG: hypothetical protein PHY54_07945 [Methylococcales bacterium]|nr:hypothetical protein [Methylococcales bacterium]
MAIGWLCGLGIIGGTIMVSTLPALIATRIFGTVLLFGTGVLFRVYLSAYFILVNKPAERQGHRVLKQTFKHQGFDRCRDIAIEKDLI